MFHHRYPIGRRTISMNRKPRSPPAPPDGKSKGEFWGNFPQTYSMLGHTNAAIHLSRRWDDVL